MTTFTVPTMVAAYHRAGFQHTKKRAGDGINGPCPCCGGVDRFWIGSLPDGGKPWMECSHGCSFEDMRSKLGLDASGHANGGGPGHKTVYSYTDEAGTPVFEVERQGAAGGRGKTFLQRHTAADGAVVWKLPPAGRGLVYHLPAVKRAIKNQDLVVVVEGEKDADRLTSLNLCATCNAGGASASGRRSKWTQRHAAHLSGAARVVVIPDADAAGLAHAESVARSVAGKVARVQVVDIAAFGHVKGSGDDVSNWLDTHANDADRNLEALTAILNAASDYQPHQPATAAETEPPPPSRTRLNRMQSTPVGCADQLLRAHGETLLVVTDAGAPTTVRVLDANSGTWGDGFDVLGSWLREMCEQHASDAGKAAITDAAVDPNQVMRDYRGALKAGIDPVLRDVGAAWQRVRAEGKSGVTECARSDLDADTRYLGAANGIVDLHTGEVLPAKEGRAKLVSVAAPHEYRPWTEHSAEARADVDRLFAHLEGHDSDYWWASLAYALHGRPSRRFYLMLGGTGGGKTALFNALHAALGPYVSEPEPGALMVSRAVNETGLSPQMGAFVSPIRLALVDEMKAGVVDTRIVKRLSGDGRITWRNLKAALRTDAATATIVFACNTGHVPRLSLHDEAVAARLREIPYPKVRNPDPDFGARMRTPARAAALLARLVQAAVHLPSHDAPPAETESVRVATAGRVDDDAGEWGLFARRVVQAGRFDKLSIQSVWSAWCEACHDGDGHHQDVAGGINRSEFPRRLREVIPLPVAKQTKVDGRNVRAWYGWTLLDDAPAETSAPDAPVEREVVSRTFQRLGGGNGCPSLLVPVFLEEDKTTLCDRVTVTKADGTPVVVSKVAYRTMFKGSNAEFETAWKSFGAPEDVDTDPKPLVVFHTSIHRWPAGPGPQPWTRALVQDAAHIAGAAGCGCATCWPARPPDHWRCTCATWNPEGATRCEAERCARLRARDDELATRSDPA